METIKKPSFQSLPQELGAKLQQLTSEFPIASIYFHPATTIAPAHLVLYVVENKYCELIEARKWLRRALRKQQLFFHVLNNLQMKEGYKEGNPFIPAYCTAATRVYQDSANVFQPETNWKAFKKRFKKCEYEYNQENEVLMNMANEFFVVEARTSVFLTYISLYEHHLTFLERLYIGHSFNCDSLTERIKYLAQYLPTIEELFVKQHGETYYLITQLEKAKQAAEEGDEMYINWDLYDAIKEVEDQLYHMVTARFKALKKRIKANNSNDIIISLPETQPTDQQLSSAISQINKIKQPEEIYLFHKTETAVTTHYYLLLIGEGIGTAVLNRMQQSVSATSNGACSVVLIGHSRFWIQERLFIHQEFFKKVMLPENRVFCVPGQQFTIHWENPHESYYGDLDYMYKATDKMVSQYFVLRHYAAPDNAEGVNTMFSTAILRAFRTLIFANLSYQPHYLSAYNLWMLCLYAQPTLKKIEYLFEKRSGDAFFKSIDYNTKFNHGLDRITEEKGFIMDEILKELKNELTTAFEEARSINKNI